MSQDLFRCDKCSHAFVPDVNNVESAVDFIHKGIVHKMTPCPNCGKLVTRETTQMVVPVVANPVRRMYFNLRLAGHSPKYAWRIAKEAYAN